MSLMPPTVRQHMSLLERIICAGHPAAEAAQEVLDSQVDRFAYLRNVPNSYFVFIKERRDSLFYNTYVSLHNYEAGSSLF